MPQHPQEQFAGPADAPDRYQLLERRSAGGEGEIWSAVEQQSSYSFRYAVKIIHAEHLADADRWLENLRLQVALLTQLEHPALVKVREVFVGPPPHAAGDQDTDTAPRLYLVMKWIEGRSLQEALESGQVSGMAALEPLEKVAEAVDYLHSGRDTGGQPVLHRDIKPANILLADDGRVYLVDFGLVRFDGQATMSKVSGTVPFMAPESLHRGEYGPASDRYAVGATVYYAMTGQTPIPGDVEGMTQRLTAVLGAAQGRVANGILLMLSGSAARRPQRAAEWLRALRTPVDQTTLGAPAQPETAFGAPTSGHPAPPFSGPPLTGPLTSSGPVSAQPMSGQPISGQPMSAQPMSGRPMSGQPMSGQPMSSGPMPGPPGAHPAPPPPMPMPGGFGPPPFGGAPPKKKATGKIIAIIGGVLGLVFVSCCGLGLYQTYLSDGHSGGGLGTDPSPSISVDRKVPPPAVGKLQPALVSVAQIAQVTGESTDNISRASDSQRDTVLMGGPSEFAPCAEGAIPGNAIGSQTSNAYYVSSSYVASAVSGFYGKAATDYLNAATKEIERCGWNKFEIGKIDNQAVAYSRPHDEYSSSPNMLVLVRSGQVVMQLSMSTDRGGAQSDATQLATMMARHLPSSR